ISRSPESLEASLQAVSDAALRLCGADIARAWLRDGDDLVAGPGAAGDGSAGVFESGTRLGPIVASAHRPALVAAHTRRTVHATDQLRYHQEHGAPPAFLERAANDPRIASTIGLAVPLLRGHDAVGVLALTRGPGGAPWPFTDREIALAESFADQAVIAIEN